jgi:hypothetical protein
MEGEVTMHVGSWWFLGMHVFWWIFWIALLIWAYQWAMSMCAISAADRSAHGVSLPFLGSGVLFRDPRCPDGALAFGAGSFLARAHDRGPGPSGDAFPDSKACANRRAIESDRGVAVLMSVSTVIVAINAQLLAAEPVPT